MISSTIDSEKTVTKKRVVKISPVSTIITPNQGENLPLPSPPPPPLPPSIPTIKTPHLFLPTPITYDIVTNPTIFTTLTCIEDFNIPLLLKILYSDSILIHTDQTNVFEVSQRTLLENILKLHFKNQKSIKPFTKTYLSHLYHNYDTTLFHPTIKVKYSYTKKHLFGRVFPVKSLSLCCIQREVRHSLSEGIYLDLDMVNCHFSILSQLFKESSILGKYVQFREEYFMQLCTHYYENYNHIIDRTTPEGKDLCKGFFIQNILFNGSYENWAISNNLFEKDKETNSVRPFDPPFFYLPFKKEIKTIADILISHNTKLVESIIKENSKYKKPNNIEGSILSWFCTDVERKILEVIYQTLKSNKIIKKEQVVLCFDGLMVLNQPCFYTPELQQPILLQCQDNIKSKFNMDIILKLKGFDQPISPDLLDFEIPLPSPEYDVKLDQNIVSQSLSSIDLESLSDPCRNMLQFAEKYFNDDTRGQDLTVAERVNELKPKHFIFQKDKWFGWCSDKKKWMQSENPLKNYITYGLHAWVKEEMAMLKIFENEYTGAVLQRYLKLKDDVAEWINSKLRNVFCYALIIAACKQIMTDEEIKFDTNIHLFGCRNGVFDIQNDIFRPYLFDDMVTMSCGCDFEELRDGKRDRELEEDDITAFKDIEDIFTQIFPNDLVKDLAWKIYASGITGKQIEKLFIFNGSGGNGKGLINEFIRFCLGDYFYEGDINILTRVRPTGNGPNQMLASIDKRRFVIFKEPGCYQAIHNSNMKDLTGGGVVKARGLYQSETDVVLFNTTVMECNTVPKLFEPPKNGDERRICDICFESTFTNDSSQVDEANHIYEANPMLKDTQWRNNHCVYFLNFLFKHLIELRNQDYKIDYFIPQCVKDRNRNYIQSCLLVHELFIKIYEKCPDTIPPSNEFLELKNVLSDVQNHEDYASLTPVELKGLKKKEFFEFFQTNSMYKHSFKERHDGKYRNVLIGYRKKVFDESDGEDEEDDEDAKKK